MWRYNILREFRIGESVIVKVEARSNLDLWGNISSYSDPEYYNVKLTLESSRELTQWDITTDSQRIVVRGHGADIIRWKDWNARNHAAQMGQSNAGGS